MRSTFGAGRLVSLWLVCLGLGSAAHAGDLGFAWNPSTGATGYRLYSGATSGNYTSNVDVGGTTQTSLTTAPDCTTQYYAVTAYNSAGASGYSSEVASWPRPRVASTSQSTGQRGTTFSLTLTGANYQAGTTVSFSTTGVTASGVTIGSCNQLTLNVTVTATATIGPTTISVTSPNGVVGTAAGLFSVIGTPLPAVQNLRRSDTQ
jgi:hypothetical protein